MKAEKRRYGPVGAVILAATAFWRTCISPLYAPCCRFEPSCSAYMRQAIEQRGTAVGLVLGIRRLLRCHPLGGSGYDPVPTAQSQPGTTR